MVECGDKAVLGLLAAAAIKLDLFTLIPLRRLLAFSANSLSKLGRLGFCRSLAKVDR